MLYRRNAVSLSERALIALSATAAIIPIAGLFGGIYYLARQIAQAL